jgi:hypothetical protein
MTDKPGDTPDTVPDKDVKARSQKLGQQLQNLYNEVVEEAVPDEFLRLLEQADAASKDDVVDD